MGNGHYLYLFRRQYYYVVKIYFTENKHNGINYVFSILRYDFYQGNFFKRFSRDGRSKIYTFNNDHVRVCTCVLKRLGHRRVALKWNSHCVIRSCNSQTRPCDMLL